MKITVLFLLILVAPFAASGVVEGSYQGWVTDNSGSVLSGVQIRVNGQLSIENTTDEHGCFFIEYQTEIGKTTVFEIVYEGYQSFIHEDVGWEPFLHQSLVRIELSSDTKNKSSITGNFVGVSKEMAYKRTCDNT